MDLSHLTRPAAPWFHLLVGAPADARDTLGALERPGGAAVRFVRGRKATADAAFFDESSAALQFPDYFGENWDAFRDCLADLSWLRAEAVVLLLADAAHLLEKATAAEVQSFLVVLNDAVQRWNGAARPFHVIWHTAPAEEEALKRRWQAAGLSLHRF